MDKQELINQLTLSIGDFLKREGFELIDLVCRYEGRDFIVRLLVDKPEGGIHLDECAWLNKQISAILDEQNILQQNYVLEVSSPGLDRPLKTKNDFVRRINKMVKFFLATPVNGKLEWDGIICAVDEESVRIDVKGEMLTIQVDNINKAKQIIDSR